MAEHPLSILIKHDPKLMEFVNQAGDFELGDGVLSSGAERHFVKKSSGVPRGRCFVAQQRP